MCQSGKALLLFCSYAVLVALVWHPVVTVAAIVDVSFCAHCAICVLFLHGPLCGRTVRHARAFRRWADGATINIVRIVNTLSLLLLWQRDLHMTYIWNHVRHLQAIVM